MPLKHDLTRLAAWLLSSNPSQTDVEQLGIPLRSHGELKARCSFVRQIAIVVLIHIFPIPLREGADKGNGGTPFQKLILVHNR